MYITPKKVNSLGFTKTPKETKIVVAMSGGVDSSTVAGLMRKDGYNVIGKTGTADKPCITGGYCGRMTSFVAAFPGNDPEYVVLVSLDNPKGKKDVRGSSAYWNAAPAAGEIIKLIAPQLNIPIQNNFSIFQEHARADN